MSRTQKGLKNLKISFISLGLSILFSFISRGCFINYLGSDVVGLSSTLLNILGFLNLAELGLTSAIAGTLYEPIYNNDRSKIIDIISIYGFLYRILGFVILSIGIIVSFYLQEMFLTSGLPLSYIYLGYYTFLSTSLVGYFISYKQTLLAADQQEYIVNSFTYGAQVIKFICQIVALKYFQSGFYIWLAIELFWGIVYGFIINRIVSKKYAWLSTSYKRGKEVYKSYPQLFHTVKQVIPHNIAAFVLTQTSSILIYMFSSLSMVTIYTNYTMLLLKIVSVINISARGLTAGFGNLIAEGNTKKTLSVFMQFNSLFFAIAAILCITCYFQTEAFITLWLGEGFLLDKWVFLIILYTSYVGIIRLPINYFIGGFVLYKDVWAPILEACINLIIAVVLGSMWGIAGVALGSAISLTLIVVMWKPYFLFKEGLNESIHIYWISFIKYIGTMIVSALFPFFLFKKNCFLSNEIVLGFCINTILIVLIVSLAYLGISCIIDYNTRSVLYRIFQTLKTRN